MWDEHRDLTPEERQDRIVEILTEGVLRIIDKKRKKDMRSRANKSHQEQLKSEQKGLSKSP